jgi:hypothetical protein
MGISLHDYEDWEMSLYTDCLLNQEESSMDQYKSMNLEPGKSMVQLSIWGPRSESLESNWYKSKSPKEREPRTPMSKSRRRRLFSLQERQHRNSPSLCYFVLSRPSVKRTVSTHIG